MHLEKTSFDLEEEEKLGMQMGCENNIRMNFGHRQGVVCVLRRLAEGI